MKVNKVLKNFETKVDALYDALYAVRDVFEEIEDEEVDYLVNGFIEQIEISIAEGDICTDDIKEQVRLLD